MTKLLPLDTYVPAPVSSLFVYCMSVYTHECINTGKIDGSGARYKKRGLQTPIWGEYKKIVNAAEGKDVC